MNTDTLISKRTALLTWRDDLIRQTCRNDGAIAVLDELLQIEAQNEALDALEVALVAPFRLVPDERVHITTYKGPL
jgi:hypothetical protein